MDDDKIKIFGPHDEATLAQIRRSAQHEAVVGATLCADGHKGYSVPIGGVLAYEAHVSPSAVGYDVGCGNRASLLDIPAKDVKARINLIMDDIWAKVSFGVGRKNKTEVDDPLFDSPAWHLPAVKDLKDMARGQLGTVGSGNHFLDLFSDELGRTWIGAHFGSRGLGHKTATWFLKTGGATDGMDVPPLVLSTDSALGYDYLQAMELAGQYAYAGRNWVCEEVARILGAKVLDTVHNWHNYAWLESHGGQDLYVVRKGSTPAFPGQRGFVGGTMGDDSVILEGIESEEAKDSLYSTVHGAGRVMSRTQARGKIDYKTKKQLTEGAITPHMMSDWLKAKGVTLRGAGLDEAPQAYKRLEEVLSYHRGSVRIVHTLSPIGVAMAGPETFDPFKD